MPLVLAIVGTVATACNNPFASSDCSTLGVAGIVVTVVDAGTNRAPTATPAIRLEDGAHVEEYTTPFPQSDPPLYSGAVERPGTYRLVVSAAGYQDYVMANINVTRGGRCNYLSGVRLTVPLVRSM